MNEQHLVIERTNTMVIATMLTSHLDESIMCDVVNDLLSHARNDGVLFFVVNMAVVDYLNTPCINALITLHHDLEPMRGRIVLANCKPSIAMIFKMTSLDRLFGLYDDLEEACDQVGC